MHIVQIDLFFSERAIFFQENGQYKGVRLASGQEVFSNHLVLDPTFTVPPSPPNPVGESLESLSPRDVRGKVARGICIMASSLKPDLSNFLVVYPPQCKSLSNSVLSLSSTCSEQMSNKNNFLIFLSFIP